MKSEWQYYPVSHCRACDLPLTKEQVMGSLGVCPCCGESNMGTIVAVREVIYRKRQINPIWKFWKPRYKYEVKKQ